MATRPDVMKHNKGRAPSCFDYQNNLTDKQLEDYLVACSVGVEQDGDNESQQSKSFHKGSEDDCVR
jgi:hypothetical protein